MRIKSKLARFNLGKIQNVVDEAKQPIRRGLHHRQILTLRGGKLGFHGQFRHAQNAIHRCAYFMAHVGQELAFCPAGCFSSLS